MDKNKEYHDYKDESMLAADYAPITELEEFDHLGVITKISIPECKNHSTVCIHFAYWNEAENKVCLAQTSYKSIYTNRKHQFQEFCEFFDLIENDQLDLTKAIGSICYVTFHPTYGIQLFPVDDEAETLFQYIEEATKEFENLEYTYEIDNIPDILKNYWYIPDYNEYDLLHNKLFGFITDVRYFQISDDDEKTVYTVTVFNDGKPVSYNYYINSRYDNKYEGLLYMLDAIEDNEPYPERTRFIPLDVWLYKAKSGRIYVNSVRRATYQSEAERKQAIILANAYRKYIVNADSDLGEPTMAFNEC